LELVDSESDEYVLKELEEAIELGNGIFGATKTENDSRNQNTPFGDARATHKPSSSLSLSHRVSLHDDSCDNNGNNNSNPVATIPFSIPTKLNNLNNYFQSSSKKKTKKKGENFISNNMPLFHLNLKRPRRRFSLTSTSVHDPFENNNLREIYNKLHEQQQQQQQQQVHLNARTSVEKLVNTFFPSSSTTGTSTHNNNISNKLSPRVSLY